MNYEVKVYKATFGKEMLKMLGVLLFLFAFFILTSNINIFDLQNIDYFQLETLKRFSIIILIFIVFSFVNILNYTRKYFVIEDNRLKYYIGDSVVHDWSLNEINISYNRITRHKGRTRFYLRVSHNGNIEEINCSHLRYENFYNDLMEIQGKETQTFGFKLLDNFKGNGLDR